MEGWLKLHRKFFEDEFWAERRKYSKAEAWLDIIKRANWKDTKIMLGNEVIEIKRGSFVTSELNLCHDWQRSKTWVRSFLELLATQGMIAKISDSKKTAIKVINYAKYQDVIDDSENQKNQKPDCVNTTERPQKDRAKTTHNTQSKNTRTQEHKKERSTSTTVQDTNSVPKRNSSDNSTTSYEFPANWTEDHQFSFRTWIEYRRQIKKPLVDLTIKSLLKAWAPRPDDFSAAVRFTTAQGYQGLLEPRRASESKPTNGKSTSKSQQNYEMGRKLYLKTVQEEQEQEHSEAAK